MTACSHSELATYNLALKRNPARCSTLRARSCVQGGPPTGSWDPGVCLKFQVAMHASQRIKTMKGVRMHLQTSFTLAMLELSKVKIAKKNEEEEKKEKMGESVFFLGDGLPLPLRTTFGQRHQKTKKAKEDMKRSRGTFFSLALPIVLDAHWATRKIRDALQGCRRCGGEMFIAAACTGRTRTVAEALPRREKHLVLALFWDFGHSRLRS